MKNQRGNALLYVMIVGLIVSVGFTTLMNSTFVVEQRAVEAELARSRVYWAEMGAFNYGISRISYSQLCNPCGGNIKDTVLAGVLQAYFNELNSNGYSWTYLDEASTYSFTTAVTTAQDDRGAQNFSGWLMAQSSYTPSSLVSRTAGALPLMELRLCVGRPAPPFSPQCGLITLNNGGATSAYFSIDRLTNLKSP